MKILKNDIECISIVYSSVIKFGEKLTGKQFADRIRETYDCKGNQRNAIAVRIAENGIKTISRGASKTSADCISVSYADRLLGKKVRITRPYARETVGVVLGIDRECDMVLIYENVTPYWMSFASSEITTVAA